MECIESILKNAFQNIYSKNGGSMVRKISVIFKNQKLNQIKLNRKLECIKSILKVFQNVKEFANFDIPNSCKKYQ